MISGSDHRDHISRQREDARAAALAERVVVDPDLAGEGPDDQIVAAVCVDVACSSAEITRDISSGTIRKFTCKCV